MEISLLGCVMGLIFAIIPIVILEVNGAKFLFKTLRAMVKMVAFLGIMVLCLYFVFKWNLAYVNVLCVLLMMVFGSLMIALRSRMGLFRYLLPVFVGVFTATILVGICLVFAIHGIANVLDVHILIPVFAILVWAMVETNAVALRTYCMGLRHHGQLYEYLLGNGATHRQAVQYFMKRAFERVSTPFIKRMAWVVTGFSPILLWCVLLDGKDVWTAIWFQILVLVATFCASVLSLYITLMVANKFSFDKYGVFIDEINKEKETEE